jgi:hypothetical protein
LVASPATRRIAPWIVRDATHAMSASSSFVSSSAVRHARRLDAHFYYSAAKRINPVGFVARASRGARRVLRQQTAR